jgi:LuxR family transcriptional regulator, maltose regulon positive regulatory protein
VSSPLLTTKFYYPQPRHALVKRARLSARLNESFRCKLALISAPAGYGKTILLVEWLSQISDARVGWLSLDEGDNDMARFLGYLIAAFQEAETGAGEKALEMLYAPRARYAQSLPINTLLDILVNDLAPVADPVILILEDYHLIQLQQIHEALTYLIEHMPANVHLVITSRAEPPLPLSRLRGRGQLVELHAKDLRFTDQEAAEFLNRSMGLNLDIDKVRLLSARTEGWIAGLQMAAVSLSNREDADSFIEAFTGSNRYIMDYLVEEVLQGQPERIQEFLQTTCLLDRLSGELCDEVLEEAAVFEGRAGSGLIAPRSAAMLNALDRANLFIIPLDDRQEWYRYHRLFADLLRKRQKQTNPQLAPRIHARASRWFEQDGNLPEAIDQSFSAGDLERAAHLIEQAAGPVFSRSETNLFLSWVKKLTDPVIQSHPNLSIYYALALLVNNHKLEEVEAWVRQAETSAPGGALAGEASTLRGLIGMLRGDIAGGIQLSRQALEGLPEEQVLFQSLAADNLGMCYVLSGDMPSAIQAFEQVVRIAGRSGNTMMAASALANLAGLQYVQGHLREAWANYQKILGLATVSGGRRLPVAGKALSGMGELAREWNDLQAAAGYLSEAIELLTQYVEIGVVFCHLSLARVRQAQEDWESAWRLFSKAQELAAETRGIPIDDRLVEVFQARFAIQLGDYETALSWAQKRKLEDNDWAGLRGGAGSLGLDMLESEYITLARLYLAQNLPQKALQVLVQLQAIDEEKGRGRRLVEVLCLQAIASQAMGEMDTAITRLGRALALAKPEGYVRTFIDEGAPLKRLLKQAVGQGIEPEYAAGLLAAMQSVGPGDHLPAQASMGRERFTTASSGEFDSGPIEPLSERELEVLQLVALGLSNPEIGARLVISLSTVKGHTANIYSKLGVNSRTQAVARARKLGILD